MRDTPARALAGKFKQASWASLPGWADDDLEHVWKAFVNNCKGLMRPVSGSLAQQARATPRAWQPVCAAAVQSRSEEHTSELQSLMRISYAVFCLTKKKHKHDHLKPQ